MGGLPLVLNGRPKHKLKQSSGIHEQKQLSFRQSSRWRNRRPTINAYADTRTPFRLFALGDDGRNRGGLRMGYT